MYRLKGSDSGQPKNTGTGESYRPKSGRQRKASRNL